MRTQLTAKGNRNAGSSCLCDRGLHRYLRNFGGGGLNTPNPPSRYATATYISTTSSKYSISTVRSTRIIGPRSVTYNNLKSSKLQYYNISKFLSICKASYIRRVYLQTPPLETEISSCYMYHNYRLKSRRKIAILSVLTVFILLRRDSSRHE